MIIDVSHLSKTYNIYKKEPGFLGSVKSIFSRKYEKVTAVSDVSFQIDEGELIGFIGPNGAGKTTTLKCLSGLLYPSEGKINVLGFNPFQRKNQYLKQIALVMGQKNQLWWDLPAMESFLLNKEIYEVSDKRFKEVLGQLSQLLDVGDLLHVPVRNLSLGQRMKMELIAALIHSPRVLFLDEPTIGLDVVMQKNLRDFIKAYNSTYNATIILTSHYMGDVEELCKRVIMINHGKLLFDGLLSELVQKYAPIKVVNVVLGTYIDPKKFDKLGKVTSFSYPSLTLEIPKKQASDILAQIMKELPVEDMTIEDPQIENIIRDIFTKATR